MVMLPNAGHISEFATDPLSGAWLTGTCGETALVVALMARKHEVATDAEMTALYDAMYAHGLAAAGGATTIADLAQEVIAQVGVGALAVRWDYQEPFPYDWHGLISSIAGTEPIILELARGGNLVDVETGASDEASVHYHFICVVGKQADGYVCADGDNPQVNQRYQIYSYDTLSKAVPCGLLVLTMEADMSTPEPTFPQALLSQGWQDDGTTTTAPNGHTIVRGIRTHWLDDPAGIGEPLENEHSVGPDDTEQLFYNGLLGMHQAEDGTWSLVIGGAGQRAQQYQEQLSQATSQVQLLTTNYAALKAEYDALHAQVAGVDPETTKALALMSAIRAAMN